MRNLEKEIYLPSDASASLYSEADFDDYHAAPLLIVGRNARKRLVTRQDQLNRQFTEVTRRELFSIAKDPVIEFVAASIADRMHQREGLNGSSYAVRLHKFIPHFWDDKDHSAIEIFRAARLARIGEATPYQNELARRAFGMGSIELANLTIINNFRKELEAPMWEAVSEITGEDASPSSEGVYTASILGFDRNIKTNQHVGAMRVRIKRHIATLPDGTNIKARTTAIVNTRPASDFDQSIIEEFHACDGELEDMSALPSFQKAVRYLIETELPEGLVLARNETVYSENPATLERVASRRIKHFATFSQNKAA